MKKRDPVFSVLLAVAALFLICTVSSVLLAAANSVTKEPIAQARLKAQEESMLSVLPENTDKCEEISCADASAQLFAAYDADGAVTAYAVATSAKGYGGTIKVMTGISPDGKVLAVNVYDNSEETPGLGAKTSESEFTEQFSADKRVGGFAVSKDGAKFPEYEAVDAVTGATISSRAVAAAVTHAVEIFSETTGGASQ